MVLKVCFDDDKIAREFLDRVAFAKKKDQQIKKYLKSLEIKSYT